MRASQWKGRLIVIERRRLPRGGRMAFCTVTAELPSHMIRGSCALVILLVTGITIRRSSGVLPTDVALSAGHCNMRTSQREGRL